MLRKYQKKPLSISEQADLLITRGLVCDNEERLKSYLSSIGYYRLSAYWYPYLDKNTNKFSPNTNFKTILSLYIFDRKLRLLVIEAIERIEVSLRAQWSRELSLQGGAHAYMNANLFKCSRIHEESFRKITNTLSKNKETFIQHYRETYDDPKLPPIWTIVEIMTFGELSHWFENTKNNKIKKSIATAFNIPNNRLMKRIFVALTIVRNICTHHNRLWNRRFIEASPYIKMLNKNLVPDSSPNQQAKYLYNYLVVIEHLMRSISPNSQWKFRLIELLDTIGSNNHQQMGFPNDWRQRPAWKK